PPVLEPPPAGARAPRVLPPRRAAAGTAAGEAAEPQHRPLHRHRAVGAGHVHDRPARRRRELARLADDRRVQPERGHRRIAVLAVRHRRHPSAVRLSKICRTPGSARIRSSARSACPGTYPLPISIVTSAATPSAPSAAALNEVAIEKKITVPPCAVARTAPPSQPGTSTQTTVTPAGPPPPRPAPPAPTGPRPPPLTT